MLLGQKVHPGFFTKITANNLKLLADEERLALLINFRDRFGFNYNKFRVIEMSKTLNEEMK